MSLWGRTRVGFGGGRGTVDVTTLVFGAALVALDVVVVPAVLFGFVVVATLDDEVAFVVTVVLAVVEAFDVVFAEEVVVGFAVVFVLVANFDVVIGFVVVLSAVVF